MEKTYNDELAGRTLDLSFQDLGDLFVDKDRVGNLTLTLRADLQRIAAEQLGEREGSVVALDPRTGAILAMVSFPTYDPNLLANHDTDAAADVQRLLDADPDKPRLAARLPGPLLPRVDVQGGDRHRRASPAAASPPTSPSTRDAAATRRRAPRGRSATSAARRAAARCSRSCGCRATPRSPQMGVETSGPRR